jgi:hypothetical protein
VLTLDVGAKCLETGYQVVNIVTSRQVGDLCCAACGGIQYQGTVGNKAVAWNSYRASQSARRLDSDA